MGASERLYLDKEGKQDVYVDLQPDIPQHQIDGIRFLYRQFKQKKPGVILNDPKGYGKQMQTFLFLKAVRSILSKSVLIICESSYLEQWTEFYSSYKDYFNDVAVKTNKPFVKKSVFINTIEDVVMFSRPSWSVVVVDINLLDKTNKDFFKYNFKTDYKIWISGRNMKSLGPDFKMVYKWIYPKENFDESEYFPHQGALDTVTKAIRLDAFLEDFFLRRTGIFPNEIENDYEEDSVIVTPKKSSSKNKDPTGTKVKRTRERETDISPNISIKNKDPTGTKVKRTREPKSDKSPANNSVKITDTTDEIVKRPKRTKRMIILDDDEENEVNITETSTINDGGTSTYNFNFETIENNAELKIKNTLDTFNNHKVDDNDEGQSKNQIANRNVTSQNSESNEIANAHNEDIEIADTEPKDETFTPKLIYEEDSPSVLDVDDGVAQNTSEDSAVDFQSAAADIVNNENEIRAQINSKTMQNDSEENNATDYKNALDEIVRNENFTSLNGNKMTDIEIKDESIIKQELIQIHAKSIKNEDDEGHSVKGNHDNTKSIDDKLKELEEYTLNKFKGSFLDRLF